MTPQNKFLFIIIFFLGCADSSENASKNQEGISANLTFESGLTKSRKLNTLSDQEARTLAYELDLYQRAIDADPTWARALCLGFGIFDHYMSCEYTLDTCMEMGPQNYEINFYFDTDWNGYPENPEDDYYRNAREDYRHCDFTVNEYETCTSLSYASLLPFLNQGSLSCDMNRREFNEAYDQTKSQELSDCEVIVNCDDPEYDEHDF